MYEWLSQAVETGTCVVTANHRLAKTLSDHYNSIQLASGREVWPTPAIRSLDSWLHELLRSVPNQEDVPQRISAQASALVWERCLRDQSLDQLLSLAALLRESQQAWRRVCDWQVDASELKAAARNSDEHLFARSVSLYKTKLRKQGWIDDAGVSALVGELVAVGKVKLPSRIIYAGFDRTVPVHHELWQKMRGAGAVVDPAPSPNRDGTVQLCTADDVAAELRAAGSWARSCLLEQPSAKLAIVVPGLEQNATKFARLIREGLVPGWQLDDAAAAQILNVSYGRKLSEYPAIHVALLLLRWLTNGLTFKDVSLLLRSPFVADIDDDVRSHVELKLRQMPDRSWSRAGIHRVTAAWAEGAAADWRSRIMGMDQFAAPESESKSPGEWARLFADCLDSVGWPGRHALSSPEFQLVNRWRELLNEFAQLETVLPEMVMGRALELLRGLAADAVYQPKAQNGVVQLLGNLESAGMEFEAVWVAGMEASRWPSAANPSNLIPRSIQLKYGMPDATPNDSLDYRRIIFSRLRQCSEQIVFSWPRTEDETELLPSPFLRKFEETACLEAQDPGWYAATLHSGYRLQAVENDPAPVVEPGEQITGGAYTVQSQRTEPFAAFAKGRLRAGEVRLVEPGISPSLRGNLVHRALQLLYRDLPSSSTLREWSGDELEDRIQRVSVQSMSRYVDEADPVLRRLLFIEKDRLQELLKAFVLVEQQRPDFSVASVEADYELNLAGLNIKLRADRLDRLPDNSLVIIDYKTGAAKALIRRDRNLKDVQLVVYACAVPGDVRGLVLANVDVRKVEYKGVGGDSEWAAIKGDDWPDRLDAWKQEVTALAGQIVAGDVRINLSLPSAQARPLALLSRVAELKRVD